MRSDQVAIKNVVKNLVDDVVKLEKKSEMIILS